MPTTFWNLESGWTSENWLSREEKAEPTRRGKIRRRSWVCDPGKARETEESRLPRTSEETAENRGILWKAVWGALRLPSKSPTRYSQISHGPCRCREGFLQITEPGMLWTQTTNPAEGNAEILNLKSGVKLKSTHGLTQPSTSLLCVSPRTLNSLPRNRRVLL